MSTTDPLATAKNAKAQTANTTENAAAQRNNADVLRDGLVSDLANEETSANELDRRAINTGVLPTREETGIKLVATSPQAPPVSDLAVSNEG